MLRVLFALAILAAAVAIYTVVRLVLERRDRRAHPVVPPPDVPASDDGLEEFRRAARARAERQRQGIAEPREDATPEPLPETLVTMDDDVFGSDVEMAEYFVVATTAPARAVVAAIDRANDRFMLVDENGVEHASWEALGAFQRTYGGDLYTPNYTADPRVTEAGVEGYVDCKGGIEPEMGTTLRRVLLEELASLGRPAHVRLRSES